jgi:MFS family permease
VPSNLLMARLGAKTWISRIAVSWGLVSAAQLWVNGYESLLVMRLLLGLSEAGLFPGVLLYISWWYPKKERGKKIAIFYMAQVCV